MATTYKKLAELTRNAYFKIIPSDDASLSLRFFAELIAQEVAEMATMNAFENSNQGESTYSNDAFISVFRNLSLLVRSNGEKYITLPSIPTALPNNQEIAEVEINGTKCLPAIPVTGRQIFALKLINKNSQSNFLMYKREGGEIIFQGPTTLLEGTADIKLIGAVSGDDLLTADLNIPKNFESRIMNKILSKLLPLKNQPIDYVNDAISNPG